MRSARVAVVQAEVAPTLREGLAATERLTRDAARRGAQLVAFGETWLPGYPAWLDTCRDAGLWNHAPVKAVFQRMMESSVHVAGDEGRTLAKIAADSRVTLVMGVIERVRSGAGQGTLYNTLLTYGPDGQLLNHHRKLMPTYTERLVWGQGDAAGLRAVDTPVGRVGGLVCWEHWMPLARQAMHDTGEEIHVAAWPTVHEMHQVASRHYAFEGRCYVLAAGSLMKGRSLPPELEPHPDKVASSDTLVLRGGSAIIAPDGSYVASPVMDAETTLHAELDLDAIARESMTLDVTGHYARPDCLTLGVSRGSRRSYDAPVEGSATPPQDREQTGAR